MSLRYSHLLVPALPEYHPEPDAIAEFAQGVIDNGNLGKPHKIEFSRVTKSQSPTRKIQNIVTGQSIEIPMPSRRRERPETLSDTSQISGQAVNQPEYDLMLSSESVPSAPPCPIGYLEKEEWKPLCANPEEWRPMLNHYYLEIGCRVRSNVVRLYFLEREDDLTRPVNPADFANYHPRFGEDCSANERRGLFVHPETGAIWIQDAGCATFWIEFNFGNWVFPRLKNNSVNILEDSVVNLARKTFDCDFVQACNWG